MSERLFDPATLMSENLAANATNRKPAPIGETVGQITKAEMTSGKSGPESKKPGVPWARLDLTIESKDPEYLTLYNDADREKAVLFHGIMVDIKDGQIATGEDKNIKLGRLREACGVQGQPLQALVGQYVRVQVGHKPHPKEPLNPDGTPNVLSEIVAVTKA